MLAKTGMVAKAIKYIYLEDECWPTTELLQGLCFPTFQNVGKYRYGCQGNQVSIFRRSVLTYIMSLASFNLISQQTTELLQGLCFVTFQGLCFSTFQNVGKYRYGCQGNQVYIFRRSVLTYNRIIAGSLFSNFSKCSEIQVWLSRQPSFYI